MADDPAPTDDDPALTFGFEWTRAGLASERAVNSTLHRHLSSVSPDVSGLPSLRVGGDDPQAFVEQERLGEGGMGVVHAARDGVLERTVAIKRPRGDVGGRASGALVAEARTLAALDHPNVVPVHQLGCDDQGAPVLVMKRVRGRRWSEVVAEGVDLDRERTPSAPTRCATPPSSR
jgi:serine/threonine protein kinase